MQRPTTRGFLAATAAVIAIAVAAPGALAISRGPGAGHVLTQVHHQAAGADRVEQAAGVQRPQAVLTTGATSIQIFLDGVYAGNAKSVAGCTAFAEVVNDSTNSYHLGAGPSEPCLIRHGQMEKGFEAWLEAEVIGKEAKHQIGVLALDPNGKGLAAVTVEDATLVAFETPPLDANSLEAAWFTSTIEGSSIRPTEPTRFSPSKSTTKNKNMLAFNFKLSVDDASQTNIKKVGAIRLSRTLDGEKFGDWTVSDLQVTTAYGTTGTFPRWYGRSALQQPPATDERSLSVGLLAQDLTTVTFQIRLDNAGLYWGDAGLGTSRVWKLYAEAAQIDFP
jgi:hypothetical protein